MHPNKRLIARNFSIMHSRYPSSSVYRFIRSSVVFRAIPRRVFAVSDQWTLIVHHRSANKSPLATLNIITNRYVRMLLQQGSVTQLVSQTTFIDVCQRQRNMLIRHEISLNSEFHDGNSSAQYCCEFPRYYELWKSSFQQLECSNWTRQCKL